NKFVWKEIERDDELIDMIFKAEIEFWNDKVLGGQAPALDGSSAAEEYLKKRYAETENNKAIDLTAANRERIQQYLLIKEQISELQSQAKE
ncbi:hypothetical protein GUF50_16305, partial [Xanthomonas citri pv. citri]|nr:hypothetical protein [Xanthomonas citri pv. citri]